MQRLFSNQTTKSLPLLLVLSVLLTGCVSLLTPKVNTEFTQLRAGQYQLDPKHARLIFKVGHMGLSTYVGRFNQFTASLDFDPNNIQASKLAAIIQLDSIDLNDSQLEQTLGQASWFNSQQFPQASFITESVVTKPSQNKQQSFHFNGLLNLKGISKPVQLEAKFHGGAHNLLTGKYTIGFSATGTIKRSDFAIDSYIPLVSDQVQLEIYAEFQKNSH